MLTRRTVLRLVATAVPGLAVGCGGGGEGDFDPEAVPESTKRFPRTPIAGDMQPTRVVFTFHVADDSPVTFRVWDAAGVVIDESLKPSGDGFHKLQVDGLQAGTTYSYAVFSGEPEAFEDRSLICTVKTPPEAGESPIVRLALLSCVGQGTLVPDYFMPEGTDNPTLEPFQWKIFEQAKDLDLDAFVHLGDQGYLDFVWLEAEGTVEAYQHAWGYYHGGGYRDLYPHAGLYASWDDHEVADNGIFDPWDVAPADQAKVNNAQQVWYQVIPIDAMSPDEAPVWRAYRWGDTVELILLDCRYELTPDQLVSPEQLAWLLERIETSPCRFICVATPKPFAAITSSSELFKDNADRWDAFLDQRGEVTAKLDALGAKNVIFVTGDIHMTYLGQTSETGDAVSDTRWEVCTTSGNGSPMWDSLSDIQFEYVSRDPHFPVLTFDPEAGTIHVALHAVDGSVAHERLIEDV